MVGGLATIAVIMGSKSDWPIMKEAVETVRDLGITCEVAVLSAHRSPLGLQKFVDESVADVFICGAGGAAHLAGAVASLTCCPVVGVPISKSLDGLDSLLAMVQMPKGVPVATVAIDGAANAAILAAQMIGIHDDELRTRLDDMKIAMNAKVIMDDDEVLELAEKI